MRGFLVVAALCALAVVAGAGSAPPALTGRFLLVYVVGSEQRLAQSRDGVRWTAVPEATARPPGSAPSAVRRGRLLYVFDGLAIVPEGLAGAVRRFRIAGTSMSELPAGEFTVRLATPLDLQRATAPSGSIAVDEAGRLTVLYTLRFEPETNACPVPGQACVKIRTATETAGTDGALFSGDTGNRAVVSFPPDQDVRDPTAFATARGYLISISGPGPCLRLLTAADLHKSYRSAPRLPGGCIADEGLLASPSGAYRPFLKEHWLYAVSEGRVVRASTRTLAKQLPARRFRPLRLPGAPSVTSARFLLNGP